ncbi:MAG: hypothetical protein M3Z64_00070 [Verrucomicrobiota bacterium]|nr:hypothetical protein [Verrucomicrobiota bacterium]
MKFTAFLFFALPLIVRGDALSDLRNCLQKLQSDQIIRARVEITTRRSDGENDKQKQSAGSSSVLVECGAQGLSLSWSPEQIQQSRKAAWEKSANPDAPKSNVATLTALDASEALNLLDAADSLRRGLEKAVVLEDKRDNYGGKSVRLLVLRIDLRLGEEGRKAMKSSDAILKLWLDGDGVPIAMDRDIQMKFSKFFLTYRVREHNASDFQVAGGKLVVSRATQESSGSGLGHSEESHTTTMVTLLPK